MTARWDTLLLLVVGLILGGCAVFDPAGDFQPAQQIQCPPVDAPDLAAWRELEKLGLPTLPMGQRWIGRSGKVSGLVQVAHNGSDLLVLARLPDEDIFNPVSGFNEESWNQGDIFEIFIRPEGQASYYEFHISPRNQRYQLYFSKQPPSSESYTRKLSTIPVDSSVSIHNDSGYWLVYAVIPLQDLVEPSERSIPDTYQVSFSRYDYTRGPDLDTPSLFSTSPHRKLSFHRQHEWTTLKLK
ncbi:hypothetical protein [Cerasicoccus fimbriatus]|uniref:hypothetical protein n=1 Tax=Cerasicoccus fimbriatus TaxID=3014554 RepID=UPI0022B55419|nr:hypothetical protein [Cerasicoccus sp. TK19100]